MDQLIVEIVGLAGTGKTTLSHALSQRNRHILICPELQLKRIDHIPLFVSHFPTLLLLYLGSYHLNRRLTWGETKAFVYLNRGEHIINQQITSNGTIILLDQGPIFKLATLNAFGPDNLMTQRFETWWQKMYKQWSSILDIIILLNAPDNVLKERINNREKRHMFKNSTEKELFRFLADYRVSYEYIIDNMRFDGKPKLLQFNTNQASIEQIVNEVLVTINLILDANLNVSVQRL